MIRLGVNVDHVATLRNARGEPYPSPIYAAKIAETAGADNITFHLREDRRHIKDDDVLRLAETVDIPLNFELANTNEMIALACKIKPHAVTIVPEKREELTTEGGLDVEKFIEPLRKSIETLKSHNILVSLFIEPSEKMIDVSAELGADAIEIHTGDFCHDFAKARKTAEQFGLLVPLQKAATHAKNIGLQAHFGHGLNYYNAHMMQHIPECEECNIGHAIISQAIFSGLDKAIRDMKDLLNDPKFK